MASKMTQVDGNKQLVTFQTASYTFLKGTMLFCAGVPLQSHIICHISNNGSFYCDCRFVTLFVNYCATQRFVNEAHRRWTLRILTVMEK